MRVSVYIFPLARRVSFQSARRVTSVRASSRLKGTPGGVFPALMRIRLPPYLHTVLFMGLTANPQPHERIRRLQ